MTMLALLGARTAPAGELPHYLIDNFSSPLPDGTGMIFSVDTTTPKVRLGALKVAYTLPPDRRPAEYAVPEQRWVLPATGKLSFWIKGDGSANELAIMAMSGQFHTEPDGRRSIINGRNLAFPHLKLDSTEWKEITLDATEPIPTDSVRWINRIFVVPPPAAVVRRGETPPPMQLEGTFELDDMRLFPSIGVEDFSTALPATPGLVFSLDSAHAKHEPNILRADYTFPPQRGVIDFQIPEQRCVLPAAGRLTFRLKGNGSGDELQFVLSNEQVRTAPDGRHTVLGATHTELARIRLDSTEWKEITINLPDPVPADHVRRLDRMLVIPGPAPAPAPVKKTRDRAPARSDGQFEIQDMQLVVPGGPTTALAAALLGPAERDLTTDFPVSLDVRNFTANPGKFQVRLSMTDSNQTKIVDRDFDLTIGANQSREFKLDLAPDNIGIYLPPFKISGDVISTDLPSLAARIDLNAVMSNSKILFDNLADVNGRWLTRGYLAPAGSQSQTIHGDTRSWDMWTMGEAYRAVPWTQTSAKISRVAVDGFLAAGAAGKPGAGPPDRFAMRFDYKGDAAVYTAYEKYFPGNAFRFGIWVKGDGSNSRLVGNFLDYSDLSDFYYGGWKRTWEGIREICRLNFTDWRYFEVPLPGNGIGPTSVRGSTDDIDFPIELTALVVLPEPVPARPDPAGAPEPAQAGTIFIGPMFVDTQQAPAATLAAMIAYDDPYLDYAPGHGAFVSIQNGWRTGSRKIQADWALADKANQTIASGKQELDIPAGGIRSFRIELAGYAAAIAPRAGPLRLQVTAQDKRDVSIRTTREIDLAKPDSVVHLADFESNRGYLGTRAEGITNAPSKGEPAARTTTAEHHSGKRSLEIRWSKPGRFLGLTVADHIGLGATRFVAIDPPIPGVSVDVTLWVKGDGSGALFYPVIGGPPGVRAGLNAHTWNLFVPRLVGGDLQDAVRLDFTDWRQFTFHFPPIPFNFDKPLPVLHFLPAYPQGLHLGVDARDATGTFGAVYVDDITVRTHLDPADRLGLALRRDSESNIVLPSARMTLVASNFDVTASRHVTISGGVYDWRGDCVAPLEKDVELKPAQGQDIVLEQKLQPGAYELRVQMKEQTTGAARLVGSINQDLLVADMKTVLGPDWQTALKDEWKLRVPIRDDFTYIDEDWDWVEFYPGNGQTDSMRNRFMLAKDNGAKPWMLLGFSAVWAASTKFEQMKAGALDRGYRDSGHGVDIFHIPERDADWDDYNLEVMRGVGNEVAGWVLWDNPDGNSTVSMPASRLARLIRISDKWRRVYCPGTPMIIGGMSRATAIPYLLELGKQKDSESAGETQSALSHISGVNVKMDVGRMSPEDSQVLPYARLLRQALAAGGKDPKLIVLTELDWAVEKSDEGLNVFDQAAYLTRSDLLLGRAGIKPPLNIINEDRDRIGTGLAYRVELHIPPMTEQAVTYNLKPAWWAMVRMRDLLSRLQSVDQLAVEDVTPQRTQAMLFKRNADGRAVVIMWRNDDPGAASFAHTGTNVESAQDAFGAAVPAKDGWYAIGKLPVVFTLAAPAAKAREGLNRLWVRDGADPAWPQRVIAQFIPGAGQSPGFQQTGGTPAALSGRTPTGELVEARGLSFAPGGSETLSIDTPAGAGLILRKRYRLDQAGQAATVTVNGKLAGTWDLKRSPDDEKLSGGIRDAVYFLDASLLSGQPTARIEFKYSTPANTIEWTAFEYRGGDFPLAALGPLLADQQVGTIRLGRNMIGGQLKVDTESFGNGIGAYANGILEYPINGQFKRFTAKVGVDAATEGRGSVIFEVWLDGKKAWSSGIMSGLDRAKAIDVDVTGANRLRLILNDAGDGNKFDAGDWCAAVLKR